MLGILLALGFAAGFGANSIFSRRGVLRASASYVANVSIFSGPVFFLLVTILVGEIFRVGEFPWNSYAFFAMSGVVHFAFGRTFGYRSIELIGVTRANIVTGLSAVVSVSMAMAFLQEVLTPLVAFGILLSISGPLLVAFKEKTLVTGVKEEGHPRGKYVDRRTLYIGMLYGAGSAIFWGSSPVLIKMGIDAGGSSILGTLTAYTAASLVISPSLLSARTRRELVTADRKALQLALYSGFTTNISQMLRFLALGYGSVIMVAVMQRTIPIWTLIMSFLFNRKLESFGFWVLVGNALLLVGTLLVIIEQIWRL